MSATTNPSFAQSFVVPENLTALSGQVSDDDWLGKDAVIFEDMM